MLVYSDTFAVLAAALSAVQLTYTVLTFFHLCLLVMTDARVRDCGWLT